MLAGSLLGKEAGFREKGLGQSHLVSVSLCCPDRALLRDLGQCTHDPLAFFLDFGEQCGCALGTMLRVR